MWTRGEMARRFREFDWAATPLGPVGAWPESWRNAVRIILDSSFPTALAIGDELIYFYNDAFIPLGGPARHPGALGTRVPVVWKEIWEPILRPRFQHTLSTGEPTGEQDLLMPLERSGYLEETYITFSFAALRGDDERPNGIFCTAYETTARVLADRQLNCLRALATRVGGAETAEEACLSAIATLGDYPATCRSRKCICSSGMAGRRDWPAPADSPALAELDRAKTTFFSNISHELLTPLTLCWVRSVKCSPVTSCRRLIGRLSKSPTVGAADS